MDLHKYSRYLWLSVAGTSIVAISWQMAWYRRDGGARMLGDAAYLVTADWERNTGNWIDDTYWPIPLTTNLTAYQEWLAVESTQKIIGVTSASVGNYYSDGHYLGFVPTNPPDNTIWTPRAALNIGEAYYDWMAAGVWESGEPVLTTDLPKLPGTITGWVNTAFTTTSNKPWIAWQEMAQVASKVYPHLRIQYHGFRPWSGRRYVHGAWKAEREGAGTNTWGPPTTGYTFDISKLESALESAFANSVYTWTNTLDDTTMRSYATVECSGFITDYWGSYPYSPNYQSRATMSAYSESASRWCFSPTGWDMRYLASDDTNCIVDYAFVILEGRYGLAPSYGENKIYHCADPFIDEHLDPDMDSDSLALFEDFYQNMMGLVVGYPSRYVDAPSPEDPENLTIQQEHRWHQAVLLIPSIPSDPWYPLWSMEPPQPDIFFLVYEDGFGNPSWLYEEKATYFGFPDWAPSPPPDDRTGYRMTVSVKPVGMITAYEYDTYMDGTPLPTEVLYVQPAENP